MNQIVYTSRNAHFLQASSLFIKSTLRSTSDLQSIKASQLVRIRKLQIRKVCISIRLRKSFALLLRNRLLRKWRFYHTKHRFSFVYSLQRYRAFCHTNCSSSLIVYLVHLSSISLSSTRMFVAFAAILSNRTMICIVIYELFISIMHIVEIMRIFSSTIASIVAISTSNDEELSCFLTSFTVLLIDFFSNERMNQQTACIDCESAVFFLFCEYLLRFKSSHRAEIRISWSEETSALAESRREFISRTLFSR